MATAGRTVVFTAVAVMAALAALLVFPLYFLRSFGYAGHRRGRRRRPRRARSAAGAAGRARATGSTPAGCRGRGRPRARPRRGGAASPAGSPAVRRWSRCRSSRCCCSRRARCWASASAPRTRACSAPTADSRQVADALVTDFPGNASAPIDIVTTGPVEADRAGARTPARSPAPPDVARVSSSAGTFATVHGRRPGRPALRPARPAQRLTVVTTWPPSPSAGQHLVRDIRAMAGPGGTDVLVGGADAQLIDTRHVIGERLPLAVGLVVAHHAHRAVPVHRQRDPAHPGGAAQRAQPRRPPSA